MKKTKLTALLLIFVMLFSFAPLSTAADDGRVKTADYLKYGPDGEIYILEEDTSKRGEFEKHFVQSDGTYVAISYAEQIHYIDKTSGEWVDADLSLSLDSKSGVYRAGSDNFSIAFASKFVKSGSEQKTVSLSSTGSPAISWNITAADKSGAALVMNSHALELYERISDSDATEKSGGLSVSAADKLSAADLSNFELDKLTSTVEYKNIFTTDKSGNSGGMSLRYSVSLNKVEEDIIIEDPSGIADYTMDMDIGTLTAQLQEDGSVLLTDSHSEMCYKIGVPYMYDAKNEICYNVKVAVEQDGSDCRITYSPDRAWLSSSERAYPVVLDPTITNREYNSNIIDTYVTQADTTNHSDEANMTIGLKSGKVYRGYVKIASLPTLAPEAIPSYATFTINHGAGTTTGKTMQIHRITGIWTASTITYSNVPTVVSAAFSTAPFNTVNVPFTITAAELSDLYNGMNYGFMIRYTDESTAAPDYNVLRTMEYPTASERPLFTVYYSYSLPSCFSIGTYYQLKNIGSGKYLDVSGGVDANGTNLIQYTGNSSASQQFKLTAVSGSGGYKLTPLMSSTRSLSIVLNSSGYVANGSNVQLKAASIEGECAFLIIPISSTTFKVVSRTNPSLALTSYGTSNGTAAGTSPTSAGNVFMGAYTGSDNQHWNFYYYNEIGDIVPTQHMTSGISNDDYYINNFSVGQFFRYGIGSIGIYPTNSTVYDTSNNLKWRVTLLPDGKYTIAPANYPTYYLSNSDNTIGVMYITNGVIPDSCKWNIYIIATGKVRIMNYNNTYVLAQLSAGAQATMQPYYVAASDECFWRFALIASYVNLSSFTVASQTLSIGDEIKTLTKTHSSASFTSWSDFTFSSSTFVSINQSGGITPKNAGSTSITVTHKPTGKTATFSVTVKKAAIIIIPGIMGSELKASNNINDSFFGVPYQFQKDSLIWAPSLDASAPFKLRALRFTEDGSSTYNFYVVNDNPYGSWNRYETLYNSFNINSITKNYDVKFCSYDWRMSNYDSAATLKTYTDNYDKVILIAHSMGGLVASNFISRYPNDRQKIYKLFTLGTPFLGSLDMVSLYGNKELPIQMDNSFQQMYVDFVDPITIAVPNMPSIYELFPSKYYFSVANKSYLDKVRIMV